MRLEQKGKGSLRREEKEEYTEGRMKREKKKRRGRKRVREEESRKVRKSESQKVYEEVSRLAKVYIRCFYGNVQSYSSQSPKGACVRGCLDCLVVRILPVRQVPTP